MNAITATRQGKLRDNQSSSSLKDQGKLPLERVAGIEIQDSQLAYDVLPFC